MTLQNIKLPARTRDMQFDLKWWRISLTHIENTRYLKYAKLGYSGLTMVGFSKSEMQQIKKWCKHNSIAYLSAVRSWDDSVDIPLSSIPNFVKTEDDVDDYRYIESEMSACDTDLQIEKLENFLETLPVRYETFVYGLDESEILKKCKGNDTRIVADLYNPYNFIVSTANKSLFMELILTSE